MKLLSFILCLCLFKSHLAAPADQQEQELVEAVKSLEPEPAWHAKFAVSIINITMTEKLNVELTISEVPTNLPADSSFQVLVEDPYLLHVDLVIPISEVDVNTNEWRGNVTLEALFLGRTNVYVVLLQNNKSAERATDSLQVVVFRNRGNWDKAYSIVTATFISILYINFGAALDVKALKGILLRPVGPSIGFATKFLLMPVLGFSIGYFFFYEEVDFRLGLFFTAVTPAGGASNIFTALLDGNLNLSVTMTAISNLAAFVMMPIWIFSLGVVIFNQGHFAIPYATIATTSFSLVVPLVVGILLQKYKPNWMAFTVRYLKTFSLILFTTFVIFAFYANAYIFKLLTPRVVFAGAGLSWFGYFLGWLIGMCLRQSYKDSITIGIETGIEHTGIAMFMLNFTMAQPTADITAVIPMANSLLTPIPLLIMLVIHKIRQHCKRNSESRMEEAKIPEEHTFEAQAIFGETKVF